MHSVHLRIRCTRVVKGFRANRRSENAFRAFRRELNPVTLVRGSLAVIIGKKQQSKMSNLFLNLLSCSTVLAPCPRRLCRQTSGSRRRPVIAPDTHLGSRFSVAGRGGKFIVAQNRTLITVQKSCTKPSYDKLRRPFQVVTHKPRQYVVGCAPIKRADSECDRDPLPTIRISTRWEGHLAPTWTKFDD